VFRNDPADVARWFHEHLVGGAFRDVFRTVVFAVLDTREGMPVLRPFTERFQGRQKAEA
jgi:uncharacterized protein (TIGR02452 family)